MEEGGAVSTIDIGLEYNIKKELGPGGCQDRPTGLI